MLKKICLVIPAVVLMLAACGESKKENNRNSDDGAETLASLVVEREIDTWAQELIDNGLLGAPCTFESPGDEAARLWAQENPDQLNGLPASPDEIFAIKEDLTGDGREDLLLYFLSKNCTGHNGGTPSFAKIIYSDGSVATDLMEEIRQAIINEYNHQRETDPGLKEVTANYLRETTTIEYADDTIRGEFRLYTADDAHCCPSYTGAYTYDPGSAGIYIKVTPASEQ